jgi:hypothetical protein
MAFFRMKTVIIILITFIFLFSIGPLFSADTNEEFTPPSAGEKSWIAGFSTFSVENISLENRYLKSSIPLLLIEKIRDCDTHLLSENEIGYRRQTILDNELSAVKKSLSDNRTKRDELLFSVDKRVTEKNYKKYTEEIEADTARLEYLEGLDIESIIVEEEKPIEFWEGNLEGKLIEFNGINPAGVVKKSTLDLLVYGFLEEIEDYIFVEVDVYSAAAGEIIFEYEDAAAREDLEIVVEALSNDLATVLLGREWATLTVVPDPPESSIYLDGELAGIGTTVIRFLETGMRNIRITARGHIDSFLDVDLGVQDQLIIEMTAEKKELGEITIESFPEGADLFISSVWMGRTPVTVPRPDISSQVIIRLEEFEEKKFILTPDSPESITYSLSRDIINWTKEIEGKKNSFYNSFGYFVLSLPLPVMLYGSYQNYYIALEDLKDSGNTDEIRRILNTGTALYYSYLGGVTISTGLFINMLYKLFDYIRSGEKLHY